MQRTAGRTHTTSLVAVLVGLLASLVMASGSAAQTTTSRSMKAPLILHAQPAFSHAITCKAGYYKNVSGNCVASPGNDSSGASAKCRDGSYSYSQHASGTCSHHGGVARWIHHP